MAMPARSEISEKVQPTRSGLRVNSRPVDMAHLSRQTMNNRLLEQEILQLFVRQARAASDQIRLTSGEERYRIIHTLKGSAQSVGAFALADCIAKVEAGDMRALKRLDGLIEQVCDFVAAIGR